MNHDISPAVERAAATATESATRRGEPSARLADWLLALLEDDEGRPYELLVRLGFDVPDLRTKLETNSLPQLAPQLHELYATTKRHSIRLRGEPSLTTDLVLYAAMVADDSFAGSLARFGLDLSRIENALRSAMIESGPPSSQVEELPVTFLPPESHKTGDSVRIIDANLNRARESLRILDDYARFTLNDRVLTEELKSLRHRLAETTEYFSPLKLLQSRDTPGDVGTSVGTASEYQRATPRDVATVNFKRLQESLRSLEEYGKLDSIPFAQEIEQLRYRAYTLERAVLARRDGREPLARANVYVLLTGSQCANTMDWIVAEAAEGGATIFQLREKSLPDRELLERARNMRKWTQKAGVLFIVNDRPDIAKLCEADGVHLGQDDLTVSDARKILGLEALVGVSTHNLEQIRHAVLDGADYIGVGPTFPSSTKQFPEFAGLNFIREAFAATSIPAFALGGINRSTIAEVVAAGANRIAVSAAVAEAEEPREAVEELRAAMGYTLRG